jgi:hypothetical protein
MIGRAQVVVVPMFIMMFAAIARTASNSDTSEAEPASAPPRIAVGQPGSQPASVNPLTGLVSVSSANYRPLSLNERWVLYWKQNYFSAGAYAGPVLTALLLDQASGAPAQWGGGVEGYGRRLASRLGEAILQGTVQAPVAAILHEDVRYISSSQHGFGRRALHAVIFSFLTYDSHGHPTPNLANFAGYYVSAAVATSWLPGQHYRFGYTFSTASEQLVLAVPVNLLQEFWPEVRRKIPRR